MAKNNNTNYGGLGFFGTMLGIIALIFVLAAAGCAPAIQFTQNLIHLVH